MNTAFYSCLCTLSAAFRTIQAVGFLVALCVLNSGLQYVNFIQLSATSTPVRVPVVLRCLQIPFFKPPSYLWGAFHFHTGGISCKTPLEQDVWVWFLVVTVQFPAHEVFPESLWTHRTGCAGVTGPLTHFPG